MTCGNILLRFSIMTVGRELKAKIVLAGFDGTFDINVQNISLYTC